MSNRMDIVDKDLADAEREASPQNYQQRHSDEIERVLTASTSSSDASGNVRRLRPTGTALSRISTQNDLERHPTELSRIVTQRSQHNATVGGGLRSRTNSRASRRPLPAFGAGKSYPPPLPDQEEYVVEFDGPDDPMHSQNWPLKKKLITGAVLGYTTMTASFASSIFSSATTVVAGKYGVGREVGILGTSLYVLGFAFGPSLWAPLSELKGRRLPLIIAMFGFSLFSIACATAKDIQTILITRFFCWFLWSMSACSCRCCFLGHV